MREGAASLSLGAGSGPTAVGPVVDALRQHWPEYLIEAVGLGLFMVAACGFAALLEHPGSPVRRAIGDPLVRRIPMGLAMGLTAIGLIYSPWGRRSGAHLNPAVTLTFWRLGKVARWDAVFYAVAHAAGGLAGVAVAAIVLGHGLAHPAVRYAATVPGRPGSAVAFVAELTLAGTLMLVILWMSNRPALAPFTGLAAGTLVALYIVLEAPLSGMSMNPARTLASTAFAGTWPPLWIYFTAPPLGMLAAAALYRALPGTPGVRCAKLQHGSTTHCIFRCGFAKEA